MYPPRRRRGKCGKLGVSVKSPISPGYRSRFRIKKPLSSVRGVRQGTPLPTLAPALTSREPTTPSGQSTSVRNSAWRARSLSLANCRTSRTSCAASRCPSASTCRSCRPLDSGIHWRTSRSPVCDSGRTIVGVRKISRSRFVLFRLLLRKNCPTSGASPMSGTFV